LAKFEHAWLGRPDLVCRGAEKNFNEMASRMEEDGEPVVDENYFKHAVAKAILWRTTEKLFDSLALQQLRAQSVAYTVAWIAERSGRRIDLNKIWSQQRCSPNLCEVLKPICAAAHRHIASQSGNPGEACKRESCWKEFVDLSLNLPSEWEDELADQAFVPVNSPEEALAAEWERVRYGFINDSRTVGELEAVTGKAWVASRHGDTVGFYAEKNWEQLRNIRGMGLKKLRGLVEMYVAATRG
jgi:hypothetical protein